MGRRRKRTISADVEKETMDVIDGRVIEEEDFKEMVSAPDEETQREKDPMASLAPSAVFDDSPPSNESSGIEVVQTFFGEYRGTIDPGVDPSSGRVLNEEYYVNVPKDSEGNPLVKFYWGSKRPGKPEQHAAEGWVPVRINENKDLDPNGRMVEVGGMVLLAMEADRYYETRQRPKEQRAAASVRNHRSQAAQSIAGEAAKAGIQDLVTVRDSSKQVTIANEKEE